MSDSTRPQTLLPLRQLSLIAVYWFGINAVWGGYEWFGQTQVELIAGQGARGMTIGLIEAIGGFIPVLVVPTFGALSDYTVSRWGKRKGYIIAGSIGDLVFLSGLALLAQAEPAGWDGNALGTPAMMLLYAALFLGLQFSSNVAQGPYQGFVPDLVAERQVGLASGAVGVMKMAGNIGGALIMMIGAATDAWGLALFLIAVIEFVLAFLTFFLVDDGPPPKPREGRSWATVAREAWGLDVLHEPSFLRMTVVRFLFLMATGLFINISAWYLRDSLGTDRQRPHLLGHRGPRRAGRGHARLVHPGRAHLRPRRSQARHLGRLRHLGPRLGHHLRGTLPAGRGRGALHPRSGHRGLRGGGLGAHDRDHPAHHQRPLHGPGQHRQQHLRPGRPLHRRHPHHRPAHRRGHARSGPARSLARGHPGPGPRRGGPHRRPSTTRPPLLRQHHHAGTRLSTDSAGRVCSVRAGGVCDTLFGAREHHAPEDATLGGDAKLHQQRGLGHGPDLSPDRGEHHQRDEAGHQQPRPAQLDPDAAPDTGHGHGLREHDPRHDHEIEQYLLQQRHLHPTGRPHRCRDPVEVEPAQQIFHHVIPAACRAQGRWQRAVVRLVNTQDYLCDGPGAIAHERLAVTAPDGHYRHMSGPAGGYATSPVMFGREAESARVDDVLRALLDGRSGLVIISGEAGIGKTRLIEEALARVEGDLRVLRGACLSLGSNVPYLPFAEILRDLASQLPAHQLAHLVGPARADLARFLPELATGADDERTAAESRPVSAAGGELERLRLYEAFLRVTERIAANQPTVVVVEDVQWIDRASLELLAFLAHGVRQQEHATLVVSVRPEEIEDKDAVIMLLAELGRTPGAERIELGPLSTAVTQRIAAAMLDGPLDEGLAEHIARLSDGNPLFAEELLLTWRRRGPDAPLPPKLRDLMAARLTHVPDDLVAVLRVAAAAGRAIDDRLLTRASGLDEAQVLRAVRAAVDDYILVRGDGPAQSGYRFRHEILRAQVAAQLLPAESRRIHAAYAEALAEEPPERRSSAELAYHWDSAGEPERALSAHVEAGHAAVAAFAFEPAAGHYRRALELWDEVDDASSLASWSREELTSAAASAAARAGDFGHAVELIRALLAGRTASSDEDLQLARSSLRWYLWEAGALEEALEEAEAAVGDATTPDRWRANALSHAAGLLLYLQRNDEAAVRAGEAVDLALAVGADEERIMAEALLGWCRLLDGDIEAGLDGLRRTIEGAQAAEAALEGRYPVGSALAHAHLAAALEMVGHLQEAVEVAGRGAATAAGHGVSRTFGSVLEAGAARALYRLARWNEARATAESALDAGAVGAGRISLLACLASLHVACGRPAEAESIITVAEGLISDRTPLDARRWLTAAAVEHALWSGDPAGALARLALAQAEAEDAPVGGPGARPAILDASVPHLLALGARACADLALAVRAAGEEPGMAQLARARVEASIGRAEARGALAEVWGAELALARAELARGDDPGTRVAAWQTACARVTDEPYSAAYAGWRLAEALLARGEARKVAAEPLLRSLETATSLGAAPLAAELTALARRVRLPLPSLDGDGEAADGPAERAFGLTGREVEVLALLAQGLANQEIAERLFISPKTASVHVSNIYGKLGVDSRVAAATMAHELGLDRSPADEA